MKNLLIWSGGMDSTACLIHLLENNEDFDTLYINLNNNERKAKKEKESREIIKTLISTKYNKLYIDNELQLGDIRPIGILHLTQPALWAAAIAFYGNEYDTIVMGYIKEDNFWHHRNDFEIAVQRLYNITHLNKKILTFWYPFEWHSKENILKEVYLKNSFTRRVFQNIWTCEGSEDEECGNCDPCKVIKNIRNIFNETKINESVELESK